MFCGAIVLVNMPVTVTSCQTMIHHSDIQIKVVFFTDEILFIYKYTETKVYYHVNVMFSHTSR